MSSTNQYRKKPVVIEAFQFQRRNNGPVGQPDWFHDAVTRNDVILRNTGKWNDPTQPAYCEIKTLEGVMRANEGDWIIRGVAGEIYPCKPDIFAATYEVAAPVPASTGRANMDIWNAEAKALAEVPPLPPLPLGIGSGEFINVADVKAWGAACFAAGRGAAIRDYVSLQPVAARELDVEAERREFEKAANAARFFPRELDFSMTKSPSGRDEYANSHLQSRWEGWLDYATRAARSAAQSTAPMQDFDDWCERADNLPTFGSNEGVYAVRALKWAESAWKAAIESQASAAQVSTEQAGGAEPPLRNEWHRRSRPWTDYLEGTKARESWAGGGFWQKTSRGWRWHLGGTFPTPGAADEVLLPSESPNNSPVGGKG